MPLRTAVEAIQETAREVFGPVLDACTGVAPGLEDLVAESSGAVERPQPGRSGPVDGLRELVIAERQRVAVTHSRLIRRQAPLMKAAQERAAGDVVAYRALLVAAAGRLDELAQGSHSAASLFDVLFERWKHVLRARVEVRVVIDERWTVVRAHIAAAHGGELAARLLADSGGRFDLNDLHLTRHVVWEAADHACGEAVIDPDGEPVRFDRNEQGAAYAEDFERRLRRDGLPPTHVLTGD